MQSPSDSLKSQKGKRGNVNIVSWTQTAPKGRICLLSLCLTMAPILNHPSFKRTPFYVIIPTDPFTKPWPRHFCSPAVPPSFCFTLISLFLLFFLIYCSLFTLFPLSIACLPTGGPLFYSVINKTWAREYLLRIFYLPQNEIGSKSKSVWVLI